MQEANPNGMRRYARLSRGRLHQPGMSSFALHVRCAVVSEFVHGDTRVRTLAFWTGEGFLDNFEYDLVNTPCEQDS